MNGQTMTRAQAQARLTQVQAQMFVLGEEAKQLAGFLNGAAAEDQERAHTAKIAEARQAEEAAQAEQAAAAEAEPANANPAERPAE